MHSVKEEEQNIHQLSMQDLHDKTCRPVSFRLVVLCKVIFPVIYPLRIWWEKKAQYQEPRPHVNRNRGSRNHFPPMMRPQIRRRVALQRGVHAVKYTRSVR
jgi:hypothetical protein